MFTPQQLTEALMLALDFTPDDLELNRKRKLSKRQRIRLHHTGGIRLTWRGLSLGLLLVGGGTSAPYFCLTGNPLRGGLTAALVIVLMPLMMIEMSLFQMDEQMRQRYWTVSVVSKEKVSFHRMQDPVP